MTKKLAIYCGAICGWCGAFLSGATWVYERFTHPGGASATTLLIMVISAVLIHAIAWRAASE